MKRILITVVATVLAVPAFAQPARLVDWQGMTFYNFSGDTAQASNCNGQCAIDWPPNYASDSATGTGNWTILTRQDGTKQWVYKGKPLYRNKNDKNPGDTSGSGVANWSIATQ
jgi:predicted lipoprotein with Yx(FWY)xxD motif